MQITTNHAISANALSRGLKSGLFRYEGDELNKRCPCCREYWPADTEFYNLCAGRGDGLSLWCKDCTQIKQRHYRSNRIQLSQE